LVLYEFIVGENEIGDEGAEGIAFGLSRNKGLNILDLGNTITNNRS